MVLGFTGFQLYGDNSGWRLGDLVDKELLSETLATNYSIAGTETHRRVIGLMQSNCASCHSPFNLNQIPAQNAIMKLQSGETDPFQMLPLRTLIDNSKLTPGNPDTSQIVCRLDGTCGGFMPPTIDGVPQQHFGISDLVRQWILEMPME